MAATRPSRPSQRSEGRGATHQPVAAAAAVTGALKIRILMYALTAPTLMEGGRGAEREQLPAIICTCSCCVMAVCPAT